MYSCEYESVNFNVKNDTTVDTLSTAELYIELSVQAAVALM